ncbi:MAG: SDR family NAD(P)-dependent oxidoreductase [Bacteroidales bacterium]|nr:SDR family NAD(P)-dependent oxidoreductase [Bacteroidales bacterium]
MSKEKWDKKDIPDLSGKVIIVTGGNSGLGYESVKAFAEKGAEVILASRSRRKGEEAKSGIMKEVPDAKITVMRLDMVDLDCVKTFSEEFKKRYKRLDIVMNNAGIMTTPYFRTKDGFEGQMSTNHLGHFALTAGLMDLIKSTKGSRVVNVSSNAHKAGKMDFDNLLFEDGRDYRPMKAYGRSKLSNLLFTYELQRRFEAAGIDAIAVAAHPGFSETNLVRYIDKKFFYKVLSPVISLMAQSAAMGALPQIRAAVDPMVKGGEYYGPSGFAEMKGHPVRVSSNGVSHNREAARKLWEASEKLTGVRMRV